MDSRQSTEEMSEYPNPDVMEQLDVARRTRNLLEQHRSERLEKLLKKLVVDYRSDKYKPDHALGFIAEMSGIDESIDKLTRIIRGAE